VWLARQRLARNNGSNNGWRINGVMAAEENNVMKAYLGENVAKYLAKIST
jgi:hypothetical protein